MSFQAKLSSGEFAVLAEMNTPKGIDISDLITNVRYLKSRIDAIAIPDMDNGVMHMSALAGGALMRQQGIEPPTRHIVCLKRNNTHFNEI